MKKISLLVLALAVAVLPGCRDHRKESTAQPVSNDTDGGYVETSMYPADENETIDLDDVDMDELDRLLKQYGEEGSSEEDQEEDLTGIFDEEGEEGETPMEEEDLEEMPDESEESQVFNWIDEQPDDELRKLYFSFNHYGIRADQKNALIYDIEQVKQLIADAGDLRPTVVVEGHADQEGARSYNIGLSERRAKSVADVLVAAGIDKEVIKVIGRGQECPVVIDGKVVNGSREERWPNRRVEIRVIYT